VFEPPKIRPGQAEPQDVVQVHLEHRLVKRVLGRFLARGFADRVNRVAAVYGPGNQPRLLLLRRVSLYGPDGRRLHEEVIPVVQADDGLRDTLATRSAALSLSADWLPAAERFGEGIFLRLDPETLNI
jgi:hypothetical protein